MTENYLLGNKRLSLKRLALQVQKINADMSLALMRLHDADDEALTQTLENDVNLGDHNSLFNFAVFSAAHETSAVNVEVILHGREKYHSDRVVLATKKLLRGYLRVLDAIKQNLKATDEEEAQIEQSIITINIVLLSDTAEIYAKFWRSSETYTKSFKAFLSRCFTQTPLLWYLSDIVLVEPKLYRISIGLKSQWAHVDKLCEMAETYIKIPKMYLWDAYDNVIAKSTLTESEIFERCKDEVCKLLDIERVLIERDFENGSVSAAAKWVQQIYVSISRDKGHTLFAKLQKHVADDTTQLATLWREAQPVVAMFSDMNKETLKELFVNNGRQMLPVLLNHIMGTLECDQSTQDFVRTKLSQVLPHLA